MLNYTIRRLLLLIPTLFGITIVTFIIVNLAPGDPVELINRGEMGSGHGWSGANYVAWNCRGSLICQQPPTAQNFAIGFVGRRQPGAFPRTAGWWESEGAPVAPRSLYQQQLADRRSATLRID